MYEQFYKLSRTPFRLHSEPEMFYFSDSHQAAMQVITQGMQQKKAVITLFGNPGIGKTTLVHKAIVDQLTSGTVVYRVSRSQSGDIRQDIISELNGRLANDHGEHEHVESISSLYQLMSQANKQIILIIDEAQLLSDEELDYIRQFIAYEDEYDTSLKLILIGHTEASEKVQLESYVNDPAIHIIQCVLEPLSARETRTYVEHRLASCGWRNDPSLPLEIFSTVYSITHGIPRQINAFFDRLLQYMEFEGLHELTLDKISQFKKELLADLSEDKDRSYDENQILKILAKSLGEPVDLSLEQMKPTVTEKQHKPAKASTPGNVKPEKTAVPSANLVNNENLRAEMPEITNRLDQLNREIEEGSFANLNATPKVDSVQQARPVNKQPKIKIDKPTVSSENLTAKSVPPSNIERKLKPTVTKEIVSKNKPDAKDAVSQAPVEKTQAATMEQKPVSPKAADKEPKASPQPKVTIKQVAAEQDKPSQPMTKDTKANNAVPEPIVGDKEEKQKSGSSGQLKWGALAAGILVISVVGIVFTGGEDESAAKVTSHPLINKDNTSPVSTSAEKLKEQAEFALFDASHNANSENQKPIAEKQQQSHGDKVIRESVGQKSVAANAAKTGEEKKASVETKTAKVSTPEHTKKVAVKTEVIEKKSQPKLVVKPAPVKVVAVKVDKSDKKKKESPPHVQKTEVKSESVKVAAVAPTTKTDAQASAALVIAKADAVPGKVLPPAIPKKEETTDINKPIALEINEKELRGLMMSFKWAYEAGDVKIFSGLFANDARTNDNAGRPAIKDDYSKLFDATDRRVIEIKNLNWKTRGKLAIGNGTFRLLVVAKDTGEANEVSGQIIIRAEKEELKERPKIKSLFYNYSVAATE